MSDSRRDKKRRQIQYADAKQRADKQDEGFGPNAIKVPPGMKLFSFGKAGLFRLRILPYEVSERKIDHRFANPGKFDYVYTYWTHQNPADNKHYTCLSESFHEKCPVCSHLAALDRYGADEDLYKSLRPKQRNLFAVLDLDARDRGVQLFEASYFFSLGEKLKDMIQARPDKYAGFYFLEDGKILEVKVEQGQWQGRANYKVKNIEMEKGEDLDEDILDKVPQLDTLPIKLPYDELEELFFKTKSAKDSPAENGVDRRFEDEDEDEDEEDEHAQTEEKVVEDEEEVPPRKSRKPTSESKPLKRAQREELREDDDDEDDDEDDDFEDDEDDLDDEGEEDELEDDEDDEEVTAKKPRKRR